MNSLTNGFLFVTALSWVLVEAAIIASIGNWWPLGLFAVGFGLMFAILGCLPVSDRFVNVAGSAFAALLGLSLLYFSVTGFVATGFLIGFLKVLASLAFLGFAALTALPLLGSQSEQH